MIELITDTKNKMNIGIIDSDILDLFIFYNKGPNSFVKSIISV